MKYFVARQKYEQNAFLDFYDNIDHILLLTASSTSTAIRR